MSKGLEELVRDKVAEAFDNVDMANFKDIYRMVVRPAEKAVIGYVLDRCSGNQVLTSRYLGVNRNTLRAKMRQYGIEPWPRGDGPYV